MNLYKANGEVWNPHHADLRDLDFMLRRIVDAIRYRRRTLYDEDPYGKAVTRLTEAAIEYTAIRRADDGNVGKVLQFRPRAS